MASNWQQAVDTAALIALVCKPKIGLGQFVHGMKSFVNLGRMTKLHDTLQKGMEVLG